MIEAVCASSFIPMMSGWFPPSFRGELALDGCYSDGCPDLGGRTITVSPFSGDADICPEEHASNKMWHMMIPPDTKKMQTICAQGFSDAMSYLQSSEEIKCGQCVSDICDVCTLKRSEARNYVLPREMHDVFDKIIGIEATISNHMSNNNNSKSTGLFHKYNMDSDGQLKFEEFRTCLADLNNGIKVADSEARNIFNDLDNTGCGAISSEKFYSFIPIINRFEFYDKDGDGEIATAKLKQTFLELGGNTSEEEIDRLMAEVDTNQNGRIDFMEFYEMTKKYHL